MVEPIFENLNYQYYRPENKFNQTNQNCIIAWKKHKFNAQTQLILDLSNVDLKNLRDEKLYNSKDNVAMFILLSDIRKERFFWIVNLHLFWDPRYQHVKYFQLSRVLKQIEKLKEICQDFVICGDFNSQPKDNVINLILLKSPPKKTEFVKNKGFEDMKKIFSDILSVNLSFSSAYEMYDLNTKNFPVTNYNNGFIGTLDHIFFTEKIKPYSLLKVRELEELGNGLPNKEEPSDHLPIGMKFGF